MDDTLDSDLLDRLRELLDSQRATEAELRTATEQSSAWERTLDAQIESGEHRLDELDADPESPLAEMARELRRVEALRNELVELRRLQRELETRAHELRAGWARRFT